MYVITKWNYNTEEWEFDSAWDTRKEARENSEILTKTKIIKTLHGDTEYLAAVTQLNVNHYDKKVVRCRKRMRTNEAKLSTSADRLAQFTTDLKLINGKRALKST
jgi:hypothetical protein